MLVFGYFEPLTLQLLIVTKCGMLYHLLYCCLLTPLKYHVFENIMENGAFALLEQMLHFPLYFQKCSNLNLIFS